MISYLIVAAILLVIALASEVIPNQARWLGFISSAVLLLFVGLRFETGHDWLSYSQSYEMTPGILRLPQNLSVLNLLEEPIFHAMAVIFRSLGATTQVWFFSIALASVVGVHFAASRITNNLAFVWVLYFGIAVPTGPMTLLRQSVSASLVLVALVLLCQNRMWRGLLVIAAAAGVHVSALAAFFVVPLARWRPSSWVAAFIVLPGMAVAALNINLIGTLIPPLANLLPVHIGFKLAFYSALEPSPLTVGSTALIAGHLLLLLSFLKWGNRNDRFVTVGIWLTLAVLSAHLYLFVLPTIWNRVMIVTLPWQAAAFWRVLSAKSLSKTVRLIAIVVASTVATSSLVYFLAKPSALPFVPYQNVIGYWITGKPGCGLERLQAAQAMAQRVSKDQIPEHLLEGDATSQMPADASKDLYTRRRNEACIF